MAYVSGSAATFEQILATSLLQFGLTDPDERISEPVAVERLTRLGADQLAREGYVLLVISEAQDCDTLCLQKLRFLNDLEIKGKKVVQIVPLGRPELLPRLRGPEMLRLSGGGILNLSLNPLTLEETQKYIEHRLKIAKHTGAPLFDSLAVEQIWGYSGGVPQKINLLCDTALVIGYALRTNLIDGRVVDEARENLGWSPFSGPLETECEVFTDDPAFLPKKKSPRRSIAWVAGMVASGCLILAVGFDWVNPTKSPQKFASLSGQVKFKIPTVFDSAAAAPRPSRVYMRIPARPEDRTGLPGLPARSEDSGNTPGREEDYESREPVRVQTQTIRGEGRKLTGGISAGQDRPDAQRAEPERAAGLVIQIAAYSQKPAALQMIARLRGAGHDAYLEHKGLMDKSFYRVRLRGFSNSAEAEGAKAKLNKLGFVDCYITTAEKG